MSDFFPIAVAGWLLLGAAIGALPYVLHRSELSRADMVALGSLGAVFGGTTGSLVHAGSTAVSLLSAPAVLRVMRAALSLCIVPLFG